MVYTSKSLSTTLALLVSFLIFFKFDVRANAADEDYFYVDAKINGRPARLILDTASSTTILQKSVFNKFGLKPVSETNSNEAPPGMVAVGTTEDADFELFGSKVRTAFKFISNERDNIETAADGMLGWQTIKNNCFILDGSTRLMHVLEEVPQEVKKWQSFELDIGKSVAAFRLQDGRTVTIDTGKTSGAALAPSAWRTWYSREQPDRGTLVAYFMPGAGNFITELFLARRLSLGDLSITDIPVMRANSAEQAVGAGEDYFGSLGIDALKRVDVVVDGRNDRIYIRPKHAPPMQVEHNRLGAIFVPQNATNTYFSATVVSNSPAYLAGIRTGDILLALDGVPLARNQSLPESTAKLLVKWLEPAGSKHLFSIKKVSASGADQAEVSEIPVTLTEILVPDKSAKASESEISWYRELGIALYKSRQPERAIASLTEAIRIAPEHGELRAIRGICYEAVKKLREAAKDLELAVTVYPTRTDIMVELGNVQLALGKNKRAAELYSTALGLNNDNLTALKGRAQAYFNQKEYPASIQDSTRGLVRKPNDVMLRTLRGEAYSESGMYSSALEDFNTILSKDPNNESVLMMRAKSLVAKHEYSSALEDLNRQATTNPNNIQVMILKAQIYGGCPEDMIRNGAKARELALSACRASEWKDWQALECLAFAYAELGDFKEAIKWQKNALEAGVPDEAKKRSQLHLRELEQQKPLRIP